MSTGEFPSRSYSLVKSPRHTALLSRPSSSTPHIPHSSPHTTRHFMLAGHHCLPIFLICSTSLRHHGRATRYTSLSLRRPLIHSRHTSIACVRSQNRLTHHRCWRMHTYATWVTSAVARQSVGQLAKHMASMRQQEKGCHSMPLKSSNQQSQRRKAR